MALIKPINDKNKYRLLNEEDPFNTPPQELRFVRYDEEGQLIHNGTTPEAVIEVLEHRFTKQNEEGESKFLQNALTQLGHIKKNLEKWNEAQSEDEAN